MRGVPLFVLVMQSSNDLDGDIHWANGLDSGTRQSTICTTLDELCDRCRKQITFQSSASWMDSGTLGKPCNSSPWPELSAVAVFCNGCQYPATHCLQWSCLRAKPGSQATPNKSLSPFRISAAAPPPCWHLPCQLTARCKCRSYVGVSIIRTVRGDHDVTQKAAARSAKTTIVAPDVICGAEV